MSGVCPAGGPDDPLVHSLLSVVDCNSQMLVRGGYESLFQPSGAFGGVLTAAMTLYVALIGYQLLLGRSQLNITEFALTAVKLGAVIALSTQWGTYQTLVYHFLFYGPQEAANAVLRGFGAHGAGYTGDVFDGLQRAFVDLTSFSPATPPGVPNPVGGVVNPGTNGTLSTLLSRAGFDALLLQLSAVMLLVSSLGALLAAKIVLAMLLALGPAFIAMMLFDSTRGVFEGWLRACIGFAFVPLAVTLMLSVALTMLEPSLDQIETMRESATYVPGVAFGVMVLVVVFACVALGLVGAALAISTGLKLPGRRPASTRDATAPAVIVRATTDQAGLARATRSAAAVGAQQLRDSVLFDRAPTAAFTPAASDRRTTISTSIERIASTAPIAGRLGQSSRRAGSPRRTRSGARSEA
jgi:type IV secretion system protein VirB6